MAVTIARGALRRMALSPGGFYVQVRPIGSPPDAATEALAASVNDVWAIPHEDEPGGSAASCVELLHIPSGPMLYIDMADAPPRLVRLAVDAVARSAEAAGLDAEIGDPVERGLYWREGNYASRHKGCGLPPGPALLVERDREPVHEGTLPTEWLDAAAEWLRIDQPDEVWFRNVSVEFHIDPVDLTAWLHRPGLVVFGPATGSLRTSIRKVSFLGSDQMRLAIVGPDAQANLSDDLGWLLDRARSLMTTADYAAADIAASQSGNEDDPRYADRWDDPAFLTDFRRDLWPFGLKGLPFLHPHPNVAGRSASIGRPRPWMWQAFGPKFAPHLAGTTLGEPLPGGAIELQIGDIDDWARRDPSLPRTIERALPVFDRLPRVD